MPRKIKVVDVAVSKVEESPTVEIPNEPKPVEIASEIKPEILPEPITIKEEPTQVEEPIKTEDDIKIVSNSEELKRNKAPTGTCELCGKTMLLKNLKYAHPKVCKSRAPPPAAPPPPPPSVIIENVNVYTPVRTKITENAKPIVEQPKTLEEQYHEMKQNKADIRKQRIKSLISNAF